MIKQIVLLIITILAAFSFSNAQAKAIPMSEEAFWKWETETKNDVEKLKRRIVTKTEFFSDDGSVYRSEINTFEKIPADGSQPDKVRNVTVENRRDVEKTTGIIWIGTQLYVLKDGQWSSEPPAGSTGGWGNGLEDKSCRRYATENVTVDGVRVRKLSVFEIFNDSSNGFMFQNYSILYDNNLRFLRKERVKGMLDPRVEKSREITTYEYDPTDLEIEAPVK